MRRMGMLLLSFLLISFFVLQNRGMLFKSDRVEAAGGLTFDLGVPNGDPIFNFSDITPGFTQTRNIIATNGDAVIRTASVKAMKSGGSGSLENALFIVISENGNDIYGGMSSSGPKSLANFFADSISKGGIKLSHIDPGKNTTYAITVSMDKNTPRDFENTSLSFDLKFGIYSEIPLLCEGIHFKRTVYGTSGNDVIRELSGNTLVISYGGDDKIITGSGNDCIVTEGGNSIIRTGSGNDVVISGNGRNKIYGMSGNDTLLGGMESVIHGGNGIDTCTGEIKKGCEH